MYNWQQKDGRQFRYNENAFTEMAMSFMATAGQSFGYLQGL